MGWIPERTRGREWLTTEVSWGEVAGVVVEVVVEVIVGVIVAALRPSLTRAVLPADRLLPGFPLIRLEYQG